MPLWQRLLVTLVTMVLTSFFAGLLWHALFNSDIPSYFSGLVGLNSSANVGVPQKSKSRAAALRSGGADACNQLRTKFAPEFYDRLSAQWRLACPDLLSSSHDYWAFSPS